MTTVNRWYFRTASVITASAIIMLGSSLARAGESPAVTISGGGVGEFLDPNPSDGFNAIAPFGGCKFAISATIDADGSVKGHYMCIAQDNTVIVKGVITEVLGIVRADGRDERDAVFLKGEARKVGMSSDSERGNPFQFCIELRSGQTGVGKFFYTDHDVSQGGPDALGLDDGYDQAKVVGGNIQVRFHSEVANIPFDRVVDLPAVPR